MTLPSVLNPLSSSPFLLAEQSEVLHQALEQHALHVEDILSGQQAELDQYMAAGESKNLLVETPAYMDSRYFDQYSFVRDHYRQVANDPLTYKVLYESESLQGFFYFDSMINKGTALVYLLHTLRPAYQSVRCGCFYGR